MYLIASDSGPTPLEIIAVSLKDERATAFKMLGICLRNKICSVIYVLFA